MNFYTIPMLLGNNALYMHPYSKKDTNPVTAHTHIFYGIIAE